MSMIIIVMIVTFFTSKEKQCNYLLIRPNSTVSCSAVKRLNLDILGFSSRSKLFFQVYKITCQILLINISSLFLKFIKQIISRFLNDTEFYKLLDFIQSEILLVPYSGRETLLNKPKDSCLCKEDL